MYCFPSYNKSAFLYMPTQIIFCHIWYCEPPLTIIWGGFKHEIHIPWTVWLGLELHLSGNKQTFLWSWIWIFWARIWVRIRELILVRFSWNISARLVFNSHKIYLKFCKNITILRKYFGLFDPETIGQTQVFWRRINLDSCQILPLICMLVHCILGT